MSTSTTTYDNNGNDGTSLASSSSSTLPLFMCAVGICLSYLYYGMLQEELFSNADVGASFLLLTQCVTNTIVALLWQQIQKRTNNIISNKNKNKTSTTDSTARRRHLHHPLLFLTAFCYFVAMQGSNEALRFVTYPTAVLAKSSKLIFTMIVGCVVEKRLLHYSPGQWLSAACITTGVLLFNVSKLQQQAQRNSVDESTSMEADEQSSSSDNSSSSSMYGIVLLCISLIMDGMLGACQGLLKKQDTPPTATETMLYVNLYAAMLLLPLSIYTNEWHHGWELLLLSSSVGSNGTDGISISNATSVVRHNVLWLNVTAAIGQIFIFLTITWYSSLICTTITTTRKFFTILLSVVYFGHIFTPYQWLAVGLVFIGLYTGIYTSKETNATVADAGNSSAATVRTSKSTTKEQHVKTE